MGFWSKLFKKKKTLAGGALQYSISVREDTEDEKKSRELLKQATQKHDKKDFMGAVEDLRSAYELMAKSSVVHPIATYLRLPLYLQKAGEFEESMIEFDKLRQRTRDSRDIQVIKNKIQLATKREEKRKAPDNKKQEKCNGYI